MKLYVELVKEFLKTKTSEPFIHIYSLANFQCAKFPALTFAVNLSAIINVEEKRNVYNDGYRMV